MVTTEINISKEDFYGDTDYDEWGAAFAWMDDKRGVEYNICMDSGENFSAIYKMELNEKTDYMETDTSTYEHYEINFDDPDWEQKLKDAMLRAINKFFL